MEKLQFTIKHGNKSQHTWNIARPLNTGDQDPEILASSERLHNENDTVETIGNLITSIKKGDFEIKSVSRAGYVTHYSYDPENGGLVKRDELVEGDTLDR